jgi:hypothetical protein
MLEVELDMVAVKFPARERAVSPPQLRVIFKEALEYKRDQIAHIQARPPFHDDEHRRYNTAYSRIFGAIARTGSSIDHPATLALALDDAQLGQPERELIQQLAVLHGPRTQAVDIHLFDPTTGTHGMKTVHRTIAASNPPVAPRHVQQYLANAGLDETPVNRKIGLAVAAAASGRACIEANQRLGVATDDADFVVPISLQLQMGLKAEQDLPKPVAEPTVNTGAAPNSIQLTPEHALTAANDQALPPLPASQPTTLLHTVSALPVPGMVNLRLSEVCKRAVEENMRSRSWADSAQRNAKVITDIFIAENGDLQMSDITRDHLLALDARLKKLPAVWGKSREDRAGGLKHVFQRGEALAAAWAADPIKAELDGLAKVGLSPGTYNRHMNTLKQLLDFVEIIAEIDKGQSYVRPNVSFLRLHETDPRPKNKRKPQPPASEVHTLLSGPFFTGCKSATERFTPGNLVFHDAGYWVTIKLILYGVRSNELCQMPLSSIVLDAPVPYFRIQASLHQSIKTCASDRDLPIAPLLMDLGFGDYVEALRARGEFWLYPELNRTKVIPRKTFRDRFFVPLLAHHFPDGTSNAFPNKEIDSQSMRKFTTNYLRKSVPSIEFGIRQSYFGHEKKAALEKTYEDDHSVDELLPCAVHMQGLISHLKPFPLRLSLP